MAEPKSSNLYPGESRFGLSGLALEAAVAADITRVHQEPLDLTVRLKAAIKPDAMDEHFVTLIPRIACPVFNLTYTWDYDWCFDYAIPLEPQLPPDDVPATIARYYSDSPILQEHFAKASHQVDLYVFVSAVAPYYTYSLQEADIGENRRTTRSSLQSYTRKLGYPRVEEAISGMLESLGYAFLPAEVMYRKVEGVTLDLCEPGQASVTRCLFFDADRDEPLIDPPIVKVTRR
jgi:hypothetical protein